MGFWLKKGQSLAMTAALVLSLCAGIFPVPAAAAVSFPFVTPQQPETALSDAPSIVLFAESQSVNQNALSATNRPASIMLRLDAQMQVQNWDGRPLAEVLSQMKEKAIPLLYIPNSQVASAFIDFLNANQISDGMVVSPSGEALRAVRISAKGKYLSGMLHITAGNLNRQSIFESCNASMARSVWITAPVSDAALVPYLQKRMVSVFLSDNFASVEQTVQLAPNGIVTTRVDELYRCYGQYYGDTPSFLRAPFIIAHRGISYLAPENTLEGNRVAIEAGADLIETDVALSKDGELIIMHDNTVDRTTNGTGKPGSMTLAQLRGLRANETDLFVSWNAADYPTAQIPTLREVLEDLKNVRTKRDGDKVVLLIETKETNPVVEQKIAALVTELAMWDQVIYQSYDVPLIHQSSRANLDKISMSYLLNARDCPTSTAADAANAIRKCAPYNASCNPIVTAGITTDFVRAANARGLLVSPYTYNWSDTKDNGGDTLALNADFPKGLNAMITDRADLVAQKAVSLTVDGNAAPNINLKTGEDTYLFASGVTLAGSAQYASKTEAFSGGSECLTVEGNKLNGQSAGTAPLGVRAQVDNGYVLFAFGTASVSSAAFAGSNPSPAPISYTDTVKLDFLDGKPASWQAQKSTFQDYVALDSSLRSAEVSVTEEGVSVSRTQKAVNLGHQSPSARRLLSREVSVSADDFLFFDLAAGSDFSLCLSYRRSDNSSYHFFTDQSRLNWKITGSGHGWSLGSRGSYQGSFRLRDALPEEAIWPDGTVKVMGIALHAVGGSTQEQVTLRSCWIGTRVFHRGGPDLTVYTEGGTALSLSDEHYDGFSALTASLGGDLPNPYPLSSGGNYLYYRISRPPDAIRLADSVSTSRGEALRDNLRSVTPIEADGGYCLEKTFTWLLMDGSTRQETLTLKIPVDTWAGLALTTATDGAGLDHFSDQSGAENLLLPMAIGDSYDILLAAGFSSGLPAAGYTVTYASSNPQAAQVDAQGHLTALGIGTSTVTARSGSETVHYLVNVKHPLGGAAVADSALIGAPALLGIDSSAWYYQNLLTALKNSVVDGSTAFTPSAPLTRGEFVRWVAKTFDLTGQANMMQFSDSVSSSIEPYAQACVAAGIIQGSLRDGRYYFDETAPLTREQMIVMLVRAVTDGDTASSAPHAFPDQDTISTWAVQAVSWAKGAGIVIGDQNGLFGPKETMTHAAGMTAILRAAGL